MSIEVVRPPTKLVTRFTSVVEPQLALSATLRTQIAGLAKLRNLLLPKLVSGEIDVSSLDLDDLVATA